MQFKRLGPQGHPMHNVIHVQIPDPYDLAMTFVRMQEWYESPKFHGKQFTLEEFMRWYSKKYGKGCFTYPCDWSGFNVPSTAVEAILNNPPYSVAETTLFGALNQMSLLREPDNTTGNEWSAWERFYLIGSSKKDPDVLAHEAAHGRFFIYPDYRRQVQRAIRSYDTKPIADHLLKLGYSKWTLVDEIHAYALTGWPKALRRITRDMFDLKRELKRIAG